MVSVFPSRKRFNVKTLKNYVNNLKHVQASRNFFVTFAPYFCFLRECQTETTLEI